MSDDKLAQALHDIANDHYLELSEEAQRTLDRAADALAEKQAGPVKSETTIVYNPARNSKFWGL